MTQGELEPEARPTSPEIFPQLRSALAGQPKQLSFIPRQVLRPAAVLAPLFMAPWGLGVVLTERRKDLRAHAGQIAFPGGSSDPADRDAPATALREAWEEVGLKPEDVQVLGTMDELPTVTGFRITPVVAQVPFPYTWVPSAGEVARIFSARIADFIRPGVLTVSEMPIPGLGSHRVIYSYQLPEARVWGVTGRMMKDLLDILVKLPAF